MTIFNIKKGHAHIGEVVCENNRIIVFFTNERKTQNFITIADFLEWYDQENTGEWSLISGYYTDHEVVKEWK